MLISGDEGYFSFHFGATAMGNEVPESRTAKVERSLPQEFEALEVKSEVNLRQESTQLAYSHDDTGSISPLIIFFFTIILILTFLVSNVAAGYIARRDLTSRVELALSSAIQEIDEFRYYYGNPFTEFLAQDAISRGELSVPIDCGAAREKFQRELMLNSAERISTVGGRPVSADFNSATDLRILETRCNGFELIATVSEELQLPFQLKLFGKMTFTNVVRVGSESIYQPLED
jgi:hypothetical protein